MMAISDNLSKHAVLFCFLTIFLMLALNPSAQADGRETLISQDTELKNYNTIERIKLGVEFWTNPESAREKQIYLAVPANQIRSLNSNAGIAAILNSPDGVAVLNEGTGSYKWYSVTDADSHDLNSMSIMSGGLPDSGARFYLYNYQTTPGLSGLSLKDGRRLIGPNAAPSIENKFNNLGVIRK